MENYKEQALSKLNDEANSIKVNGEHSNHVLNVIKEPVLDALKKFINQDNEFAQAIVQGGSLSECFQHIIDLFSSKRYALSDIDTYSEAVKFFFPTATIHFVMTIDVCGNLQCGSPDISATTNSKSISLSFDDLFGGE